MENLPHESIAFLPTPIESLARLSAYLQGPSIYIKRDDMTGLAFGGNKTRKLEYLLAEAKSQNADLLVTAGAVQSNHCRQTAAAAARSGMACILVLTGDKPTTSSANYLLDGLFGAEIVWSTRANRDGDLQKTVAKAASNGRRPYLVPYGGSSPTGAAAYAYAIQEMLGQCRQPDYIVFASSSGGTQSGMVVGARAYNYTGKVLGISVDEKSDVLQERIARLAGETARLVGENFNFSPHEILVDDQYLGKGYGVMGDAEWEAIHLFAGIEGVLVDPVYTGRAAAGLIDLIRKGFFTQNQTVLFWHTGGTPALFAENYSPNL
jgi:D-cysteine desulfhydrase family pyridoxal phosphate-dependent enzyme